MAEKSWLRVETPWALRAWLGFSANGGATAWWIRRRGVLGTGLVAASRPLGIPACVGEHGVGAAWLLCTGRFDYGREELSFLSDLFASLFLSSQFFLFFFFSREGMAGLLD